MAYTLNMLEGIKALVFAPAASGLAALVTYIVSNATSSAVITGSAISSAQVLMYAAVVGGITFAVVILNRAEKFLVQE